MSPGGISFNNQVVVIAGAGNDTGKNLAILLASRGASILFNDEDVSFAKSVVKSIRKSGGKAIASNYSPSEGDKTIDRAIRTYGSIHVLINTPPSRKAKQAPFQDLTDAEWDAVQEVKNTLRRFGNYLD
jgi:NAD(P)-dependent dehydrogenase (short-subunit alcohol dehydrogenase family)